MPINGLNTEDLVSTDTVCAALKRGELEERLGPYGIQKLMQPKRDS
jgi:hypothetical protein